MCKIDYYVQLARHRRITLNRTIATWRCAVLQVHDTFIMEYDNENDNSLIQNYSFDVRTPELDATGVNAARTRCSNENI